MYFASCNPWQLEPAAVAFPNATALSCKGVERELRSEDFRCIGRSAADQLGALRSTAWREGEPL